MCQLRTRGLGLRDNLSLRNVLGVCVGDGAQGEAGLGEGLTCVVLVLTDDVRDRLHVHALGDVEVNLGALMDGFTAFRIGASDRTGGDVVREFLLNGRSKSHRVQFRLNIREGTTVRRGHRQVGAGAIFGPPPASANDRGCEEQHDEGGPQGGTLVRLGVGLLRSIRERGRRVDSGDRRRCREGQRPRKLSRDQLGVERTRF